MSHTFDQRIPVEHATLRPNGGLAGWLMQALRHLREQSAVTRGRAAQRQMRVVETINLGARKQLLLIDCAGERFLVGTGPDSVQSVTRLQNGPTPSLFAEGAIQ